MKTITMLLLTATCLFGQDRRALVDQTTGEVIGFRDVSESAAPANPVRWVTVVEAGDPPAHNPATHKPPQLVRTVSEDKQTVTFTWAAPVAYTPAELDAIAAAQADDADRATKGQNVSNAITTLRQWADDAAGVTVTTGNNNAVTQQMVTRLGIFFDRFADLVESQRLNQ